MLVTSITTTLTASAVGAVLKPLSTELVAHVKRYAKSPERVVFKALSAIELGRRIYSVINVKTLWNIEKEVSLFDFYYPSRIAFPGEKSAKSVTNLSDFPAKTNFVLQGTAGQGKSIFLRYLYGQLAFSASSHHTVSIFVELRRITKEKSIADLIADALQRAGLPTGPELVDIYLASEKIILLLDGFDEISFDLVSQACDELEQFSSRFPNLRIIVTSRPEAAIQKSAHFRVAKIDPLQLTDHKPFLDKICRDKSQAAEIHQAINKSVHAIGALLTTPLLLTLLVLLYRAQSSIPTNLSRFYEQLFDVLFLKHDQTKPGFRRSRFTNLDEVQLKNLFEAFSFNSQISGKQIFTSAEFETHANEAKKLTAIEVSVPGFQKEVVKTACLMIEDGLEISFTHKSVAEFYAASFVQKSPTDFAEQFYAQLRSDQTFSAWRGELSFLKEVDKYRFARFFEIPELELAITLVSKSDLASPEGQREKILNDFINGASAGLALKDHNIKISQLRNLDCIRLHNYFEDSIWQRLVHPLFSYSFVEYSNILDFYKETTASGKTEVLTSVKALNSMMNGELKNLLRAELELGARSFQEKLDESRAMVERENQKIKLVSQLK